MVCFIAVSIWQNFPREWRTSSIACGVASIWVRNSEVLPQIITPRIWLKIPAQSVGTSFRISRLTEIIPDYPCRSAISPPSKMIAVFNADLPLSRRGDASLPIINVIYVRSDDTMVKSVKSSRKKVVEHSKRNNSSPRPQIFFLHRGPYGYNKMSARST